MFKANYVLFDRVLHFFRPCRVCRWVSVSYSTAGFKNLPNNANLRMHHSNFLLWRSFTPEQTQQNGKNSIIFQTSSTRTFKNLRDRRETGAAEHLKRGGSLASQTSALKRPVTPGWGGGG